MATIDKIKSAVREALLADFDNVKIISVNVERMSEYEDDDFLSIEVVFEGMKKDIDTRMVSGAVRHVRPKLKELGEKAFPLFSFVSKGEVGLGKLAAT